MVAKFNGPKSAERIASLLKENGVKQKELAAALGINNANVVSYWKTLKEGNYRQPTVEQFASMADYFGVSVDYLMGLTPDKRRGPSLADELGLSAEAVDRLLFTAHDPQRRIVLTTILESEEFFTLIRKILLAQEFEGRVNIGKLF